jgi:hypothetical protein
MLTIYDKFGSTRSMAWLRNEFGNVEIMTPGQPNHPYFEIIELRENDDIHPGEIATRRDLVGIQAVLAPATIIVKVLDHTGQPIAGIDVAWWSPDAPAQPGIGWGSKGVIGTTNANGDVGHAMGGGAYYDPRVAQGPHRVWIAGDDMSQLIAGLGMIAGTNHRHIDVTYQEAELPTPGPGPSPGPDLDKLLQLAEKANDHIDAIVTELMTYRCGEK